MYIIPAIDIIEGKCVRLTKGDYATKKVYNENPLEVAKAFESEGFTRLHLVDLDGAKSGRIVNYKILQKIAKQTKLRIDFGGGLKRNEDVRIAFESGADQITGGTIAVKNRAVFEQWLADYGSEKIILGADVKNLKIAVHGWQEESQYELFEFLESYQSSGIQYVICTDVSKDGLLKGSAVALYEQIVTRFPKLKLVASGGVTSKEELEKLKEIGCYGAIIGKAIYEGKLDLTTLSKFN